MPSNTQKVGQNIENKARTYLEKKGLKYKDSNFECKCGEIDLIMEDIEHLVFVEVRFRKSKSHGGALASVSASKRSKLIRTAKLYLLEQNLFDKVHSRFDIVTCDTIEGKFKMDWFKNAFTENFI